MVIAGSGGDGCGGGLNWARVWGTLSGGPFDFMTHRVNMQ